MIATVPLNEAQRLAALRSYHVLDTAPEQVFDDIAFVASKVCGTPIALVSLVDERRQWFKARVGLGAPETSREHSFCAHAILEPGVMIVPDASLDARFADNPLVTGAPHIRFYAGATLDTPGDTSIGSLCVIDRRPRQFDADQRDVLKALSRQVVALLVARRTGAELADALGRVRLMAELLPMCAYCRRIRNDDGTYSRLEEYLGRETGTQVSHGYCPECVQKHFGLEPGPEL